MKNTFYIVKTDNDWYRLHVLPSHYCLGASDNLDSLLKTVENTTAKCKTPKGLERVLSRLEDKGQVNEIMTANYEETYRLCGDVYTEEVLKAVEEGLNRAKFDTPFHKLRKRPKIQVENTGVTTKNTTVDSSITPTIKTGTKFKPFFKRGNK